MTKSCAVLASLTLFGSVTAIMAGPAQAAASQVVTQVSLFDRGGPWLRNFDPATGRGIIISVTSRGTMTEDGVTTDLSGAAFTAPVRELYDRAGEL